jgi:hypothetical protein
MTLKRQNFELIEGSGQDLEQLLAQAFFCSDQMEIMRLLKRLENRNLTIPFLVIDNSKAQG